MTNITTTKPAQLEIPESSKAKEVLSWIVDHIPTAVVVGLIALYYISMSHVGI